MDSIASRILEHPEELLDLNYAMHDIIVDCLKEAETMWPRLSVAVSDTRNTELDDQITESDDAIESPLEGVGHHDQAPLRTVWAGGYSCTTRLDRDELDALVAERVHPGTFHSALESAAYHVTKHSRGKPVEDFLNDAFKLVEFFKGEVSTRLPGSFRHGKREIPYVRVIKCHLGKGHFTWDYQLLYYSPREPRT